LSSEENGATAMDNMYRKFLEVWMSFFEICEQTVVLIAILQSPPGAK